MKGKESGQYGKDFPARLRLLLDESGTNQNKLAEAIGKTRQTVSLYCVGQAKPDIDALLIIATFFEVTTDWLLGVPGAPMREDKGKRALMGTCGMNEDAACGLLDLWRMDYQNVMNALFTSPQLIDAANMLDSRRRHKCFSSGSTDGRFAPGCVDSAGAIDGERPCFRLRYARFWYAAIRFFQQSRRIVQGKMHC